MVGGVVGAMALAGRASGCGDGGGAFTTGCELPLAVAAGGGGVDDGATTDAGGLPAAALDSGGAACVATRPRSGARSATPRGAPEIGVAARLERGCGDDCAGAAAIDVGCAAGSLGVGGDTFGVTAGAEVV